MTDPLCDGDDDQVTRPLGRYRGRTVHLAVRATPSLAATAPEEFAVTLFITGSDGSKLDLARIDTADAGVHFDRLYLPEAHPLRKDLCIDIVDYRDAQRQLIENWRDYVETFEEHHGLP